MCACVCGGKREEEGDREVGREGGREREGEKMREREGGMERDKEREREIEIKREGLAREIA